MSDAPLDTHSYDAAGPMDLYNLDTTTPDEISSRIAQELSGPHLGGRHVYPATAYTFALSTRPDMFKLHSRQIFELQAIPEETENWPLTVLAMLHWYICNRVEHGIAHEMRFAQTIGCTREQVGDLLGLAFMHSGPSGMGSAYNSTYDLVALYPQVEGDGPEFPSGWEPDAEAIHSGMDFSHPDLTSEDRDALFGWYESTIGEVPRSIRLLIDLNPRYAKAHRAKFERAFLGHLPKQLIPYILFHYEMNRGFRDGMREWALLARTWGVSRDLMINCITLGVGYMAGQSALYQVSDAIGDLLADWPE
jgi:hypothetical protein